MRRWYAGPLVRGVQSPSGVVKRVFRLFRDAGEDWLDDNAPRLAAALAFYTLLSLAPLLVVAVSVAGLVFGDDAARGQIAAQLDGLVGPNGAAAIESVLAGARSTSSSIAGTAIGTFVLFIGASGMFGELQSAMNMIWEVGPRPGRGVRGFLRDHVLSFTAVLGAAFLLLVSLVVSAVLAALGAYFETRLPGGTTLWQVINLVMSFATITAVFALIFKLVPDVTLGWRDVWVGAAVTAVLFVLGKLLIGLYLGRSGVASPYGAAGSVVILVIWVYYSAQILFFGAEFTQVYARSIGSHIEPTAGAVWIDCDDDGATSRRSSRGGPTDRARAPLPSRGSPPSAGAS
jgi:membrane protein